MSAGTWMKNVPPVRAKSPGNWHTLGVKDRYSRVPNSTTVRHFCVGNE